MPSLSAKGFTGQQRVHKNKELWELVAVGLDRVCVCVCECVCVSSWCKPMIRQKSGC